jgi:hypothetical protein
MRRPLPRWLLRPDVVREIVDRAHFSVGEFAAELQLSKGYWDRLASGRVADAPQAAPRAARAPGVRRASIAASLWDVKPPRFEQLALPGLPSPTSPRRARCGMKPAVRPPRPRRDPREPHRAGHPHRVRAVLHRPARAARSARSSPTCWSRCSSARSPAGRRRRPGRRGLPPRPARRRGASIPARRVGRGRLLQRGRRARAHRPRGRWLPGSARSLGDAVVRGPEAGLSLDGTARVAKAWVRRPPRDAGVRAARLASARRGSRRAC